MIANNLVSIVLWGGRKKKSCWLTDVLSSDTNFFSSFCLASHTGKRNINKSDNRGKKKKKDVGKRTRFDIGLAKTLS